MAPINGANISAALSRLEALQGIEGFKGLESFRPTTDSPSFKEFLMDALNQVNTVQFDAERAVEQLATGGDVNPAEVLTAVQKADLSFRMMMQIRNKLVQAYQEIQNIRI